MRKKLCGVEFGGKYKKEHSVLALDFQVASAYPSMGGAVWDGVQREVIKKKIVWDY